jgi:hypothetical protein
LFSCGKGLDDEDDDDDEDDCQRMRMPA